MEIVPVISRIKMLIIKFIPSTPIPLSDQIQAAHPFLRNLDTNKLKFLNLVPIYTTREIVPVAIQKCIICMAAGTILRVI